MKPRDYLADRNTPMSLRVFLEVALAEPRTTGALPPLYAKTKREYSTRNASGIVRINTGDRVRVTDVDSSAPSGSPTFWMSRKRIKSALACRNSPIFRGKYRRFKIQRFNVDRRRSIKIVDLRFSVWLRTRRRAIKRICVAVVITAIVGAGVIMFAAAPR